MKLEVIKYTFQLINGEPKIVISMVKQMDDEGKYLKFAKLRDIYPELSKHDVTFKPLLDDPDNLPF